MKKFYSLLMAGMFFGGVATAQSSVTFQVDMTGQTVSTSGVHVAGDFQQAAGAPGNWDPSATQLTQIGSSTIYATTVNIPNGTYQFKFLNGNAWGTEEAVPATSQVSLGLGYDNGNGNRFIAVRGNDSIPAVLFGGAAPAGMENVTMVLDMTTQSTVEDTVSVAGDFQGWSPGTSIMTDLLGDSIYRYVAYVSPNDTLNFKYVNGNAWGQDESVPSACAVSNNRQLIVAADTVFGPTCYAQCGPCAIPDTFDVTLQVDMSATCGFDPANDTVDIAGPFNGWSGGDLMTDTDGDLIYEITLTMPTPSLEYKARFISGGNANWEPGGNNVVSFSSDTTIGVRCFGFAALGACAPKPAPSDITFEVDMTNGPASFTKVFLIADFTTPTWQSGAIEMTASTTSPGVFETTVTGICAGKIAYKYMIEDGSGNQVEESFIGLSTDTACLEPSGTGDYNRFYQRPDDQPKTLSAPWERCSEAVGLDEDNAFVFSLYPNPFSGFATLELGEGLHEIQVVDLTGKEVWSLSGKTGTTTLDASYFEAGVYLVRVTNATGFSHTEKVIIQ